MAAKELRSAWARSYGLLWAGTLAAALAVMVAGEPVRGWVRATLALTFAPATPQIGRAAGLWAHNLPIAAWPLLLTPLGAHRTPAGRRIADLLLAACIVANALPVGAALGAYGTRLIWWVPQLPLEWAGLACGAAWWLTVRQQPPRARAALAWLGICAALLLAAALIETFLAGAL